MHKFFKFGASMPKISVTCDVRKKCMCMIHDVSVHDSERSYPCCRTPDRNNDPDRGSVVHASFSFHSMGTETRRVPTIHACVWTSIYV